MRNVSCRRKRRTSLLFRDIKLSRRKKPQEGGGRDDDWVAVGAAADAPWTLVAISIVCARRSQPQQTPSGLLPPLTPVPRRRGSYARAQCQRKREDHASEGRRWWKDMRQHAARRARRVPIEYCSRMRIYSRKRKRKKKNEREKKEKGILSTLDIFSSIVNPLILKQTSLAFTIRKERIRKKIKF